MTSRAGSCISVRVPGSRATVATTLAVVLAALASRAAVAQSPAAIAPPQRAHPNIVLVIADQWRQQDLGYTGNRQVRTPNLDRLKRQSVDFALAVANTPACSPTRASLLTGRYATQTGVFYNDKPLALAAVTLAEVLGDAGYRTALIGKWHLDGSKDITDRDHAIPADRRQGFQTWLGAEATHDYWNSVYYDGANRRHVWPGYDAAAQTDAAKAYIAANRGRPFFLMLSLGPPHDPYATAPPADLARYARSPIALRPNVPVQGRAKATAQLRGYYAHIAALDRLVGELERAVTINNLARDTIFIFTSDHGDMLQSQGQELKQKPWDESIRVPFLLRWPGKLKPRTVGQPFSSPDIMPTLLDLAGIETPRTVTGLSFAAAARGGAPVATPGALLMLPTPFGNWNFAAGGRAYRGIRTERYTYAADRSGGWLLYDNRRDPYQLKNLIADPAYASVRVRLVADTNTLLARIGDDFAAPQCYMDRWKLAWDQKDAPTDPADAICPKP